MKRKRVVDKNNSLLDCKIQTDRLRIELLRKSTHLSALIFPISFHLLHLQLRFIQFTLLVLFIIFSLVEFYRLRVNRNIFINRLLRGKEKTEIGINFYTITTWFLIFLSAGGYDFVIAELAILSTHMGDGTAAIIGKAVGRHRLILTKHKTWEGFFAGVIVTLLTGGIFLLTIGYTDKLWWAIIPGFVVGTLDFFEGLPNFAADNVLNPSLSLVILLILESL